MLTKVANVVINKIDKLAMSQDKYSKAVNIARFYGFSLIKISDTGPESRGMPCSYTTETAIFNLVSFDKVWGKVTIKYKQYHDAFE